MQAIDRGRRVAVPEVDFRRLLQRREQQLLVVGARRLDPLVELLLEKRTAIERQGRLVVGHGLPRLTGRLPAARRPHQRLEALRVKVVAVVGVQEISAALADDEVLRDVVAEIEGPAQEGDGRVEVLVDHRQSGIAPEGIDDPVLGGPPPARRRQVAEDLQGAPNLPGAGRDRASRRPVNFGRAEQADVEIDVRRGDGTRRGHGRHQLARGAQVGGRVRECCEEASEGDIEIAQAQDRDPVIELRRQRQGLRRGARRAVPPVQAVGGEREQHQGQAPLERTSQRLECAGRLLERGQGALRAGGAQTDLAERQKSGGSPFGVARPPALSDQVDREALGPVGIAAPDRQDRLLFGQAVQKVEKTHLGEQGPGLRILRGRPVQIAGLAHQLTLGLQNVGGERLQAPLVGDLPRVTQEFGRPGRLARQELDARQVQVRRSFLGAEARVVRACEYLEAFRGPPEISEYGVRQPQVVGDHEGQVAIGRLSGARQCLLPAGEGFPVAVLAIADDRQCVQDPGQERRVVGASSATRAARAASPVLRSA